MAGKISEDTAVANVLKDDLVAVASNQSGTYTNYANTVKDLHPPRMLDVRRFGVLTSNSAAANATALQTAINYMNAFGGGVLLVNEAYPCNPVILKSGVGLRGPFPPFKGMPPANGVAAGAGVTPAGGAFLITSSSASFLKLEGNNSVENLTFYYPSQNYNTYASRTNYPATIAPNSTGLGYVNISGCTFVGSISCIDFYTAISASTTDIAVDLCYGYPLGGQFLALGTCLDIPRITRCHVNPGVGLPFLSTNGVTSAAGLPHGDNMIQQITHAANSSSGAFLIVGSDQITLAHCFVFGQRIGFHIQDCYGSLTDCSSDTCGIGAYFSTTTVGGSKYRQMIVQGWITALALWNGDASAETQYGMVFDGNGTGSLNVVGAQFFASGFTGAAPIVVSGSSTQRLNVANCFSTEVNSGGWTASGVSQTNGSATVTGSITHY
jgi:hypothetical protein